MNLEDFVKETISSIIRATSSLQKEFEDSGAVLNPPLIQHAKDLYQHNNSLGVFRRVEIIEFDVAVTATSETSGGGRGGLKVFSLEASAGGEHARSNQEASRVKFSIPLVLPPSSAEHSNIEVNKRKTEKAKQEIEKANQARRGKRDGW